MQIPTKRAIKAYRHFSVMLWILPLLLWFKLLEMTTVPVYTVHSALDDVIPFCAPFIIPYLMWFPYMLFGVIYSGLNDKREYYRLVWYIGSGMAVAYILYMIFPNAQALRPESTGAGFLAQLVHAIYLTDTPTNVCPSIHVINSIAVCVALLRTSPFSKSRVKRYGAILLTVLICISTAFVKQHSVIDIGFGVLTAWGLYIAIYRVFASRFEGFEPAYIKE